MHTTLRPLALAVSLIVASSTAALVACSSSDSTTDSSTPAQQGAALVTQNACASCHGTNLSGSDTPELGTHAYGANLTPDKDTGIGSWDDAQIATAIRTGVDDEGNTLCNVMPRFSALSDTQVNAIVAYLRSLPAVAHSAPESECGDTDAGAVDAAK